MSKVIIIEYRDPDGPMDGQTFAPEGIEVEVFTVDPGGPDLSQADDWADFVDNHIEDIHKLRVEGHFKAADYLLATVNGVAEQYDWPQVSLAEVS